MGHIRQTAYKHQDHRERKHNPQQITQRECRFVQFHIRKVFCQLPVSLLSSIGILSATLFFKPRVLDVRTWMSNQWSSRVMRTALWA